MKNIEDETKCTIQHIQKTKYSFKLIYAIFLIVCVIILVSLVTGCFIQKQYNKENSWEFLQSEKQKNEKLNQEKALEQELKDLEEQKAQEQFINSHLPVLTQQGIDRMNNIYFGDEKRVFLTFDDRPSNNTEQILDILEQNEINATFFVIGNNVANNPELVKKAWEKGNYIASHGMTHRYEQIYVSQETVLQEYCQCVELIQSAIGQEEYNPHLFRFPGGKNGGKYSDIKTVAYDYLIQNGVYSVDWSALSGDAEGNDLPVEKLLARCDETVAGKNNIVFLMHDTVTKTTTVEALPQIISYFRDRGYNFYTFYDIFDTKQDLKNNKDLVEIK